MLEGVSYYMVLGKPLIMWLGVLTFLSFSATAIIGFLIHRRIRQIPFHWHKRMAALSFAFAAVHGTLGILLYV